MQSTRSIYQEWGIVGFSGLTRVESSVVDERISDKVRGKGCDLVSNQP